MPYTGPMAIRFVAVAEVKVVPEAASLGGKIGVISGGPVNLQGLG